jgi:hypothetical protein
MGSLSKVFGTNKKKEVEGVWVDGEEGMKFLIARANNEKAEKLATELMRPHRRLARAGKLPEEVQRTISYTVLANAILLGWKGVKDDNGVDIPYSPAEAERQFRLQHDFADYIAGYAQEASIFRDEDEVQRQGNSVSASSGT